tara:strand:- start:108 stop:236 length:129 start_codon:yes stop_codon:yes gene_type:complete
MRNIFFKNSLVNETIEALGFKTTGALEKELEALTLDSEKEKI